MNVTQISKLLIFWAFCFTFCLHSEKVLAQTNRSLSSTNSEIPSWYPTRQPPATKKLGLGLDGMLGLEVIDGDWFLRTVVGLELKFHRFRIGVQAPMRFLLRDSKPLYSPERSFFFPRPEDWDHWTDFARILRYVVYGQKNAPLYILAGQLASSQLGHGTLVSMYTNTINKDRYHIGVEGAFHTAYGGAEWLLNSILEPRLLGARGYIRPVSFVMPESFWTRLAIGASIVIDAHAPYQLKKNFPNPQQTALDDSFVQEFRALSTMGIDVELAALRTKHIDLTPYLDFNMLLGYGVGLHIGSLLKARIPLSGNQMLSMHLRLEYRMLGAGYLPQYFNTYYDKHRYQRDITPLQQTEAIRETKLYGIEKHRDLTIHGWYGEAFVFFQPWFRLAAYFDDYQGPNNSNLTLQLQIPQLELFQLGATYSKRGFDGFGEIFSLDHRSLLVAELRIPFAKYFAVVAEYQRLWQTRSNAQGGIVYEGTNNFSLGVSANIKAF